MTSAGSLLWIARVGYAGRGFVFLLLGLFAMAASLDLGFRPVGASGAIRSLVTTPAGVLSAVILGVGLAAFAVYRVIEAILDIHEYGNSLRGILNRIMLGASGVLYATFAMVAASIVFGWGAERSSDESMRDWTAWLMGMKWGPWIVGISGIIVIATGIGLGLAGLWSRFRQRVHIEAAPRTFITILGKIGFVARSIILLLIGAFLVFAALTGNPDNVQGFGSALQTVERQPYGNFLLGLLGSGLLAFGLFGIGEAVFARIKKGETANLTDPARQ